MFKSKQLGLLCTKRYKIIMAICQYRFIIMPKESVIEENFIPKSDDEGFLEDNFYWNG